MALSELKGTPQLMAALEVIAGKLDNGGTLKVGFFEDARYADAHPVRGTKQTPLPVAQVAFWNEYGTTHSPPRPFFRDTIKAESPTWGPKLGQALVAYSNDSTLALRALGQSMRDDVAATIQRYSTPGNAPATIQKKGFDKPLVDSAILSNSPDFKVEP